jgi:hypothetical protein
MTRDDIILMARKAGGIECDCCLPYLQDYSEQELAGFLERFAERVAAAEREECAIYADKFGNVIKNYSEYGGVIGRDLLVEYAADIRARRIK